VNADDIAARLSESGDRQVHRRALDAAAILDEDDVRRARGVTVGDVGGTIRAAAVRDDDAGAERFGIDDEGVEQMRQILAFIQRRDHDKARGVLPRYGCRIAHAGTSRSVESGARRRSNRRINAWQSDGVWAK